MEYPEYQETDVDMDRYETGVPLDEPVHVMMDSQV